MELKNRADTFLKNLLLKSRNNIRKGYSHSAVATLSGLNKTEASDVIKYLSDKNLVDAKSGYGDAIIITTQGIDHVGELKKGKKYKTLKFLSSKQLPTTTRHAYVYLFEFQIFDEGGKVTEHSITVTISDILGAMWHPSLQNLGSEDSMTILEKVLMQIAKDRIFEKVKEDTLTEVEELILLSDNSPNQCPVEFKDLIDLNHAEYEIEISDHNLSERITNNSLAAGIIEARDNINALFHSKFKKRLLLLNEERNLLDFFKDAHTEEEFSHRIASLGQVSRDFNLDVLKRNVIKAEEEDKSLQLLEKYLHQIGIVKSEIVNRIKNIGRIRQGYPIHTDLTGVIKALTYFQIDYPINDYSETWNTLLQAYHQSLRELLEILKSEALKE